MSERILIVDDEPTFREAFARVLREEGFDCLTAADGEKALDLIGKTNFDVVFSDINMPGMNGIELLQKIGERSPDTLVIMITAYGSYETAVEAMRHGAFDYISKPVNFDDALLRIRRLLEHRDRLNEIRTIRRDLQRTYHFENIVGRTPSMKVIFDLVQKVAATKSTVLITGESGTGKELIARAIHYNSEETRERRFVPVNCAAIPETLLESELFGHVKGSFTGATADKKGLFEVAEGGSIFLDEIGEMSPVLQAKLLRAIEEKEIVRVGGIDPIRINLRIICSTNRDLGRMVEEKQFRSDLYYRINVVEIHLPPLRERKEDIPVLVAHFVEKYNRELKRSYRVADHETLRLLLAYDWKGNVRELENVIERAMILGDGQGIRPKDLPSSIAGLTPASATDNLREAVHEFERLHIHRILEKTDGDKEEAARIMGIGLSSLYRKLEELESRTSEGLKTGGGA